MAIHTPQSSALLEPFEIVSVLIIAYLILHIIITIRNQLRSYQYLLKSVHTAQYQQRLMCST